MLGIMKQDFSIYLWRECISDILYIQNIDVTIKCVSRENQDLGKIIIEQRLHGNNNNYAEEEIYHQSK